MKRSRWSYRRGGSCYPGKRLRAADGCHYPAQPRAPGQYACFENGACPNRSRACGSNLVLPRLGRVGNRDGDGAFPLASVVAHFDIDIQRAADLHMPDNRDRDAGDSDTDPSEFRFAGVRDTNDPGNSPFALRRAVRNRRVVDDFFQFEKYARTIHRNRPAAARVSGSDDSGAIASAAGRTAGEHHHRRVFVYIGCRVSSVQFERQLSADCLQPPFVGRARKSGLCCAGGDWFVRGDRAFTHAAGRANCRNWPLDFQRIEFGFLCADAWIRRAVCSGHERGECAERAERACRFEHAVDHEIFDVGGCGIVDWYPLDFDCE